MRPPVRPCLPCNIHNDCAERPDVVSATWINRFRIDRRKFCDLDAVKVFAPELQQKILLPNVFREA